MRVTDGLLAAVKMYIPAAVYIGGGGPYPFVVNYLLALFIRTLLLIIYSILSFLSRLNNLIIYYALVQLEYSCLQYLICDAKLVRSHPKIFT